MRRRREQHGTDEASQDLTLHEELVEITAISQASTQVGTPPPSTPAPKKRTGLNKTVWMMAIVAVVCLAAGIGLSRFVISPAQAAAQAQAPEAGPITVEATKRALSSDVVARGDALYDDAVQVKVETTDIGGAAIVTGAIPEVGKQVDPGTVLLEVTGRPVIALPGELPTYRTLRAGTSGPDVVQLQQALAAVGIDAGDSGTYDAKTAAGVAALYSKVGYTPPLADESAREALKSAQDGVRSAEDGLAQANTALRTAQAGPPKSERIAAQNEVNSAQRAYDDAVACSKKPATVNEETGQTDCGSIADLKEALDLEIVKRDEALAARDSSDEVAARDSAQRAVDDARKALTQAQDEVLTPLPASEIVYIANLPRRVDTVTVSRGSTVNGAVMSISGATLEVVAKVDSTDAALLAVGQKATLVVDDLEIPATVAELNAKPTRGAAATSDTEPGAETGEALRAKPRTPAPRWCCNPTS